MKKVIHTADWHLGAKFDGRDRAPEHEKFIAWFLDVLKEELPDLVIISGDIFDTGTPSNGALKLYYDFLAKVWRNDLAKNVLVVGGNHDSPTLLTAPGRVLDCLNVTVIGDGMPDPKDEALLFESRDGGKIAVAAVPFLRESQLRNAAPPDAPNEEKISLGFKSHVSAAVRAARALDGKAPLILTGHCTLRGAYFSEKQENEPCVIGGVEGVTLDIFPDADYIALGHLHIAQAVLGKESIRYAGSPIPLSFSEAGSKKSVVKISFDDNGKEISLIDFPFVREMVRFRGSPDELLEKISLFLADNPTSKAWIEVVITKGTGDALAFNEKLKQLLTGTELDLCIALDRRECRDSTALRRAASRDLLAVTPMELAIERLNTTIPPYSQEEIDDYKSLLQEALSFEVADE